MERALVIPPNSAFAAPDRPRIERLNGGFDMIRRRAFLMTTLSVIGLSHTGEVRAAEERPAPQPLEPLVWPLVGGEQPGIRAFSGHANTVLDIVGRIGTAPSLVIYTEGNHLMVLLSKEIVGAFPAWAKTQPQYAHVDLDNVVVVTMPQPIVVQMIRTGAIALGNLTLDVSRASGLFPDVVMSGPGPQRELRKLGIVEPQARYFSRNRGRALLVRKGNPLGIHSLADVARTGARVAQADSVEAGARAGNRAAIEALIGKPAADAFFAKEVEHFPGRLGITHRDVPEMIARGYADVGLTQYHLISYWVRTFPNHFELVPIMGAERFPVKIAFGRVIGPLRPEAAKAFEEFFFSRARDVYPRYDFARMTDDEYGAVLELD
jgi:Bacterial extracellular solute-binding protein